MRHKLATSVRSLIAALGAAGVLLSISARRPDEHPVAPANRDGKTPVAMSASLERRDGAAGRPRRAAWRSRRHLVGAQYKRTSRANQSTAADTLPRPVESVTEYALSVGLCGELASHCQEADNFNAQGSTRGLVVAADDFVPRGSSITGLCWWGAYRCNDNNAFADCQAETTDAFQVRYFADNGGVPGTLLATITQGTSGDSLIVTGPSLTGATIAASLPEYAFTATHLAVAVEAGVRHWIEITNGPGTCGDGTDICEWFWEISSQGNARSMQDGDDSNPPNGYALEDESLEDLAFCLSVALEPPDPPANDECSAARVISGTGLFSFDLKTATTDGPAPANCPPSTATQIANDVWYRWTSLCTDTIFVRSCRLSEVDTMIAVYDGGAGCVPSGEPLACNDDLCGSLFEPFQSMVTFEATFDQTFLIRIGRFPGPPRGDGEFEITCGPDAHAACSSAVADCCDADVGTDPAPGCLEQICCETVCMCDPFCCDNRWDASCALLGFEESGCGATALCPTCTECGTGGTGDCCAANETPNCDDAACCNLVVACDPQCAIKWDANCAANNQRVFECDAKTLCPPCQCPSCENCVDSTVDCCDLAGSTSAGCSNLECCEAVCRQDDFCCDFAWNSDCAGTGFGNSGFGAAVLCTDICAPACLPGPIRLTATSDTIVDARQPYAPDDPGSRQGIREVVVAAPLGADDLNCWELCESVPEGAANFITGVVDNGNGTVTITFNRIISLDAVTKLTYTAYDGSTSAVRLITHPGNSNGDARADAGDVTALMSCVDGTVSCEAWECDMDLNGRCAPADILRLIDILTGPDYGTRLDSPLPEDGACPTSPD